jgi:CheY-like chemotaxis protein
MSVEKSWGRPDDGSLHVLVIDDSAIVLELTREWLKAAGYRVTTRELAVGTANAIHELRPDVALIDVLMPGIRGDDLARMLKRHPLTRQVAIILYSSLATEELRPLIMLTGALGVIEKTSNQALFTTAFKSLTARLRPMHRNAKGLAARCVPSSGAYRVDDDSVEELEASIGGRPLKGG